MLLGRTEIGRLSVCILAIATMLGSAAISQADDETEALEFSLDTVLNIFDTTVFGSSDPAGLSYDPTSGTLLLVDSEVEETAFFTGSNGFRLDLLAQPLASFSTTAFSDEPTGVVYNTVTGTVFVTDDDQREVFEVDISATPPTVLSSFSTLAIGIDDPEGISAHPVTGNLFIAEGIGGIPAIHEVTTAGTPVSVLLAPEEIDDPEGVHYDPVYDRFLVVSSPNRNIFELSRAGALIADYDIQPIRDMYGHLRAKGIVLAPSSDTTDDASVMSVYFADYNFDEENDGRIFELALPELDIDQDGSTRDVDCNDHDDTVFPGAVEIVSDGVDQDCNGYDLTIEVTSVMYIPVAQVFHVVATSQLAGQAALNVDVLLDNGQTVTRNLRWRAGNGVWTKQVFRVEQRFGAKPQSLILRGIEGDTQAIAVPGPANGPYFPDPEF